MLAEHEWSEVCKRIDAIDLEPILVKITDSREGEGWSLEDARDVSGEYRQFLKLSALQGEDPVAPTKRIDTMWHYHILDTAKYQTDCEAAFGFFLHHFPYFGMRGEEDRRNLEHAFQQTLERVAEIFGEPWETSTPRSNPPATSDLSICSSCGTSECAPDQSCSSVSPATLLIRPMDRPRLSAT